MALKDFRVLLRSRMNALGFHEHVDAFDDQNIPQTTLDKTYVMDSAVTDPALVGQIQYEFGNNIDLKIYLAGGRDNVDLVDRAHDVADTVLADILQTDRDWETDL